jgi:ATPase subunit of ABC transporter with duplicated ATPase domains
MGGIDKDFTGEAWPGENITVGYLAQEPQLDPSKSVLENVKDARAPPIWSTASTRSATSWPIRRRTPISTP